MAVGACVLYHSDAMPVGTRFAVSHRLIHGYVYGHFGRADVERQRVEVSGHPLFDASFNHIMLFADGTELDLSAEETRALSGDQAFNPPRRALTASADLIYGMARLFAAHREFKASRIFRSCARWQRPPSGSAPISRSLNERSPR
jgi:hypothetical protein